MKDTFSNSTDISSSTDRTSQKECNDERIDALIYDAAEKILREYREAFEELAK